MMKTKNVFFICILLFSMNCHSQQIPDGSMRYGIFQSDGVSPLDLSILGGNVESYNNFVNNFQLVAYPSDDLIRTFLFYSFVMAERYGNRFAAYNCFFILNNAVPDSLRDSSLVHLQIHLLEIGALADTSKAEVCEMLCAYHLSELYGGTKYVEPDPQKKEFYRKMYGAMRRNWRDKHQLGEMNHLQE